MLLMSSYSRSKCSGHSVFWIGLGLIPLNCLPAFQAHTITFAVHGWHRQLGSLAAWQQALTCCFQQHQRPTQLCHTYSTQLCGHSRSGACIRSMQHLVAANSSLLRTAALRHTGATATAACHQTAPLHRTAMAVSGPATTSAAHGTAAACCLTPTA